MKNKVDFRKLGGIIYGLSQKQMEEAVLKVSKTFPVVMVCGQRQTGSLSIFQKTTENMLKAGTIVR